MNHSDTSTAPRFMRVGLWFSRYRAWGLIPLMALGLFVDIGSLPVRTGILMMVAGGVGIFAGTLLRIMCRTFSINSHGDLPHEPALITDGPFAITRNPVFLSEISIALGIAMMSRMPWLVLATLVAAGLVFAPVIEWQEEVLRRKHPTAYTAYARLVPRWFSIRNLLDRETYLKSRHRVPLLTAVRGESITMLVALVAILAFLAKANLEMYF